MGVARDRQLDGLRAVAVSLVLYAHFFAADGSHLGHIGVRLFFVLSGFLITRLLLDARDAAGFEPATALKSFYARRALRIFPPYFGILGLVWLAGLESSKEVLAWHALYLSNFWYALQNEWSPWVLCHTWSLSIEEQFYIVWPLIILVAPRRSIARICLGVILCSIAYRFYWPLTGTPSLARDLLPPASMDALAAGGLLAAHRCKGEAWPQWAQRSATPLLAVSLVLLWLRPMAKAPVVDWLAWIALEVFPLVPLTMLVGNCSRGIGGYLGRLVESGPLTALGRVSYGVYLYHATVLAFVVEAQGWIPVNVSEQGLGRLFVASAGTLIVASISWLAFEKPLNALKRHFPYIRPGGDEAATGRRDEELTPYLRPLVDRSKVLQKSDVSMSVSRAMPKPLVSVLLPVYNGEPYLGAALESILRQDYRHLEIVAIDDGSTDRSLEILERYRKADSRISVRSRENRGLITTLNEGLALASGDLVARMDADDISYATRFSRQVALFREQPRLAMCGTGVDTLIGDRIVRGKPSPIYRPGSMRVLSMFFTIFIHSTVVFNRRLIPEEMLIYDGAYPHAEDFDLFRRVADRFPAMMIDEALVAYRIHGDSVTSRHQRQMRQTHLKIVAENLEREGLFDDASSLREIGVVASKETIRVAAEFIVSLERKIASCPPETRQAYEDGMLCFFYFLYQLIADEKRPELTHDFLTRTGKWNLIRRRERYGLFVGARAPWCSRLSLAATKRVDALARHLQSVPAASVLPQNGVV